RASIVIRSIPTSEILTHASITIPLSSTRSRTSIKLVPPGALSTAICFGSFIRSVIRAHARFHGAQLLFSKNLSQCLRLLSPAFCCCFAPRTTASNNFGRLPTRRSDIRGGEFSDLLFKLGQPFAQFNVFRFGALGACRQVGVVAPPVQTDLLGFIDRANQQTNLQSQKLHIRQRHFDVASDYKSFIKNTVENINQTRGTGR